MVKKDPYLLNTVGNYSLVRRLASSNFSWVYLAEHLYLNRKAVVKILKDVSDNKEDQDAFPVEAKYIDMLKHRHVLPIIDVGKLGDVPYIIMEYAPGGSLADLISSYPGKRLPMWQVLLILAQIGSALHFAHQNKVVHRDLKPANILFNEKEEAVLADFGISLLLKHNTTTRVPIVGTFPYMAPEQFEELVSFKSDQYALACIAYQLFTGELPIQADAGADYVTWKTKALHDIPVPLHQLNPDVPIYIEEAILKALAKKRSQRHADVDTFINSITLKGLVDPTLLPTILIPDQFLPEIKPSTDQFRKTVQQWVIEGNNHYNNKRLEEALISYEQAILIGPDKDILYNLKGTVLYDLKRYTQAIEAYNEAIRLSPDKAIFYLNKGEALRSRNAFEEALDAYEEAIRLAPNNANNAKAHAGKGDACSRLNREKEALDAYERACKLDPTNPLLHRNKGDILRRYGHYQDALLAYEQAIKLTPTDETLQNRKKIILKLTGRF